MRLTLYEIETDIAQSPLLAWVCLWGWQKISVSAVAWLAAKDKDAVGPTLSTSINSGMNKLSMRIGERGRMIFPDAQIAVCGPSVIDLLIGEKSCCEVQILESGCNVIAF